MNLQLEGKRALVTGLRGRHRPGDCVRSGSGRCFGNRVNGRTEERVAKAIRASGAVDDAEPPRIPSGLPSQLLERRPDIAAAERRVAEANAEVGIARSAYYPTVVLSATVGLEGSSIANWLAWPSRFRAAGPEVLQTLFDAGRRHATNDAALAAWNATVANYRQTSLDAFQQVEDNLAALRILAKESETQRGAVASAQRSLDLSMNRYTGGLVTYLEVVTAQSTALANERTAVDIQRRRMDASALLVKAPGGGWDASQLPVLKKGSLN
jgi:NodT family efflux transporter outer membrane factor (OMF) lipoprotein